MLIDCFPYKLYIYFLIYHKVQLFRNTVDSKTKDLDFPQRCDYIGPFV